MSLWRLVCATGLCSPGFKSLHARTLKSRRHFRRVDTATARTFLDLLVLTWVSFLEAQDFLVLVRTAGLFSIPVEAPKDRIGAFTQLEILRSLRVMSADAGCLDAEAQRLGALTPARPVSASPATMPVAGFATGRSARRVRARPAPWAQCPSRGGVVCGVSFATARVPHCALARMPVETSAMNS